MWMPLFIAFISPSLADSRTVYFYYGDGCPHCALVEPFIQKMADQYPDVDIRQYEVYKNKVNASRLMQAFEDYGIPFEKRGVPVVFLNGTYFLGDSPILENLENEIKKIIPAFPPVQTPLSPKPSESQKPMPKKSVIPFESEKASTDPISSENAEESQKLTAEPSIADEPQTPKIPSLWMITSLALVDSINPCAIAVLVILLSALLAINEKKRALSGGLAFTAAIYISYFLFGLGISYSLHFLQSFAYWIFKGVGVLAVFLGAANIKDYLWYGKGGFVMEIPLSWRPRLKNMLRGVTSPAGAFLIGFAVTLFELPCTGGPYFVMLGLLAVHKTLAPVIPILAYYNFFFVLPLLIITGMIYGGLSTVEGTGQWKDRNIRILHLVAGAILAGLGLWILLS